MLDRPMIILSMLLTATTAAADVPAAEPRAAGAAPARWSAEADLVQPWIPEVRIFTARVARTLWGDGDGPRGDAMAGVYIRPHIAHNIVRTIDEYLVSIGYRQLVWRGLHVEAAALAGWSWGTHNKIDGMDYSNPVLLVEGLAGYRIDLGRFYVTPQVGGLVGVVTDIGPRGGKSDAFVEGKLLVGVTW